MTTYKEAGVDIDKASRLAEYIKEKVRKSFDLRGVTGFGGFAEGVELKGYKNPVIFSTTDGVGTKLKIAQELGIHNTVGIDLVAMNVNDLITTGADPLFFLDYIATGKLEEEVMRSLIDGIIAGCREGEVLLLGGETAEMPGFYPEGVYDLAGFCVGACEKERIIDGRGIKEGDLILGLKSSGFHSNGYSLIRKVLKDKGISLKDKYPYGDETVGEVLLTPTRIYVKAVKRIKEKVKIKGIAHITGGGIPENLVRILPKGVRAVVEEKALPEDPLFGWIMELGKVPKEEMFRTFNMGIGMVLVVAEEDVQKVKETAGEEVFVIGHIEKGSREVLIV